MTLLMITLFTGNKAVYDVQPQHVSSTDLIRCYGKQIAVEIGGKWYQAGGKVEVTDQKTIGMMNQIPEVTEQ